MTDREKINELIEKLNVKKIEFLELNRYRTERYKIDYYDVSNLGFSGIIGMDTFSYWPGIDASHVNRYDIYVFDDLHTWKHFNIADKDNYKFTHNFIILAYTKDEKLGNIFGQQAETSIMNEIIQIVKPFIVDRDY
ncbi:MAG TPA: hypothetical protein PKC96_03955 [Bacilli bacterium]|nr:hypothetical protein [Bacilli bacterium]